MRVSRLLTLSIFLVFLSNFSIAQNRKADVALRLLTDVETLNFVENDTISYNFEITNNGPDTLKATDLLWLEVIVAFYVNNPVILKFGKKVAPGEKLEFTHKFKIRGNINADSINSCVRIYKVYSYNDPDTLDREPKSQLDDNDSCFMVPYSLATTSIEQLGPDSKIIIYPNPVTDYVNIYSPTDAEIIIRDSYGRELDREMILGNTTETINLSNIGVRGIYYITTVTKNYSSTSRILKAR